MNNKPDNKDADNGAAVFSDVESNLGGMLREVYADVINEPVPDRFVKLLNKLNKSSPTEPDNG